MDSYVRRKIDHLKRAGLVANNSTGFGQNGGAAPDWLSKEQKERAEMAAAFADREMNVGRDIEW